MTLEVGTIAHWRDFGPGCDKFIYILGTNAANEVLSFTISSQLKYLAMQPHAQEMVEIPRGTVECLQKTSFIQCFYEVQRTPISDFRDLERRGCINYRASLPQFAPAILERVEDSQLLDGYDQDSVIELLRPIQGSTNL
jgi:hypothetical protein